MLVLFVFLFTVKTRVHMATPSWDTSRLEGRPRRCGPSNFQGDRRTVVRYGKWMCVISKANVVNCNPFVTWNLPAARLEDTPVFALNRETDLSREIVSLILPPAQEAPDSFDRCQGQENLCLLLFWTNEGKISQHKKAQRTQLWTSLWWSVSQRGQQPLRRTPGPLFLHHFVLPPFP